MLSKMLPTASDQGIFSGIVLPNCHVSVTHLQYADDVIPSSKILTRQSEVSSESYNALRLLSGLRLNFQKSNLFSFSEDALTVQNWATY